MPQKLYIPSAGYGKYTNSLPDVFRRPRSLYLYNLLVGNRLTSQASLSTAILRRHSQKNDLVWQEKERPCALYREIPDTTSRFLYPCAPISHINDQWKPEPKCREPVPDNTQ